MSGRIRLSPTRRAIVEMLRYAQKIPTIPVARTINVGKLARARSDLAAPPSWSAIFIRAYGLVCNRFHQLRRVWVSWPVPHLYEHPHSECAVAVERDCAGEKAVLMGRVRWPEQSSLAIIQKHLQRYQEADLWTISPFRASLRFGRLPTLLQRLLLWARLDWSGKERVKNIGTFSFTNYGMLGAESLHPIGPQTTVMTLGPLRANGEVTVKLIYDHRVLDGTYIARSLAHLDEVLHSTILGELTEAIPAAA